MDGLDNIISTCKSVLKDLNGAKATGMEVVAEFRKHLDELVNELEKKTIELLDIKHHELSTTVASDSDKALAFKKIVRSRLTELQHSNGNASRRFVCQTLGKQMSYEADALVKTISKSTSRLRLLYKNDRSVSTYLSNLHGFGTVKEHKKQYGHLKSKLKYDVSSDGDEELCNIWGTCTIGNGNILLADNANNKLKLLDKASYKMVATCTLPASPRSLCRINDSEMAVSLSNKCIVFISTVDGLEITKSVQLDHNCFGLAMTDAEMYISDGSQKVFEYTLEGALLRDITTDPSGESLFAESRDITVSDDGNTIYVADSRKGIVTLNKEGKILWRYTGSDLKGAYGVCTGGSGNLLVTGILSHNVLQFGTNGERLGEVIRASEDVQSPVSVCYDRFNERIIVTKNGNYIFAFDFE